MQLRALPLFMRWAISPNPMVAAVLGAVVISAEVLLLRSIGKWLGRYPSVRNASDNIRNAMNMLMEVALLVGSIFAAIKMAGYTGFSIAVAIYFLNESWAVRYRKWRHRSWQ